MSKILETFKNKSVELLITSIVAILGVFLAIIIDNIVAPFVKYVLPEIPLKTLFALIGILLVLQILSIIVIILQKNKLAEKVDLNDYNFDKKLGVYIHKITKLHFCTSCIANNIISPLKERQDGWVCARKYCEQYYINPTIRNQNILVKINPLIAIG